MAKNALSVRKLDLGDKYEVCFSFEQVVDAEYFHKLPVLVQRTLIDLDLGAVGLSIAKGEWRGAYLGN